ncbi:MAG: hypothetical protein K2M69_05840 [Muribaculaceae bacterium]|nr:hypothetical protein [Muribaculaceae bacterium]
MAIKLQRYAKRLVEAALERGEITKDSSARIFLYDISRYWRMLLDATDAESEQLPGWNERDELAAEIILSAAKYLQRKYELEMSKDEILQRKSKHNKCRNLEHLLEAAIRRHKRVGG